jgi:hypothetical protein
MAFLGPVADALLSRLGLSAELSASQNALNFLTSKSGISYYLRLADSAGLSGRTALSIYRQLGGTVGNSTFWNIRKAVLQVGDSLGGVITSYPTEDNVVQIPGGRQGIYRIDFTVHVKNTLPDGSDSFTTRTVSMTQRNYDPDAAAQAMQQWIANYNDPEAESGQWLAFAFAGAYKYTG